MKTDCVRPRSLATSFFAACLFGLPFFATLLAGAFSLCEASTQAVTAEPLELSRAVRPWEFLPIVGTRSALFGNEAGRMEAWVYPLKLLR
jgi:hypothetical protein